MKTLTELELIAAGNMHSTISHLERTVKSAETNLDKAIISGSAEGFNLFACVKGHLSCNAALTFLKTKFKQYIGVDYQVYVKWLEKENKKKKEG